ITRQMPLVSGFGSAMDIAEDPGLLYQKAAENLLRALESEESYRVQIGYLLSHLDNNPRVAIKLLAEMLAYRQQWLPYIGSAILEKKARAQLEKSLVRCNQEALEIL